MSVSRVSVVSCGMVTATILRICLLKHTYKINFSVVFIRIKTTEILKILERNFAIKIYTAFDFIKKIFDFYR